MSEPSLVMTYWRAKGHSDASRGLPHAEPRWVSDEARAAYREGFKSYEPAPRVIKRVMDDGIDTRDGIG